jgi:predicted flap endonuclease-1-like 5' DNA nuclease
MIFTLTIFQSNLLEKYDKTDASIEILIMLFVASLLGFLLGYFMSHRTKKEFVYNDVKTETSSKSTIVEKFNQMEKEASISTNNAIVSNTQTAKKETIAKVETKVETPKVETPKPTAKKTVAKTTEVNNKVEPAKTAKKTTAGKKTIAKTPVSGTKNDLKVIEGIGPAIEKLLNAKNINTYKELADSKIEVIQEILNEGGPRFAMHSPETWPMQAQLLFENRMEDFKKLTEELKGGKIVK